MLRVPLPYIMQYDVLCIHDVRSMQFLFRKPKLQIYQLPGRYYHSTDLAAQPSSCCRLVSFYPIWIQPSHQAAVGQYLFIQSGYSLAIKLLKLSISITNLVDQPSSCYKIVSFYQIWQPSHQATIGISSYLIWQPIHQAPVDQLLFIQSHNPAAKLKQARTFFSY